MHVRLFFTMAALVAIGAQSLPAQQQTRRVEGAPVRLRDGKEPAHRAPSFEARYAASMIAIKFSIPATAVYSVPISYTRACDHGAPPSQLLAM